MIIYPRFHEIKQNKTKKMIKSKWLYKHFLNTEVKTEIVKAKFKGKVKTIEQNVKCKVTLLNVNSYLC